MSLFMSHYVTRVTELHVFVPVPWYESILRYIYHNGYTLVFWLHCLHMTTSTCVILSIQLASKTSKLYHTKFVIICTFYDSNDHVISTVRSCLVWFRTRFNIIWWTMIHVKVRNFCREIILPRGQVHQLYYKIFNHWNNQLWPTANQLWGFSSMF